MIRDRSLLTSWNLNFEVFHRSLTFSKLRKRGGIQKSMGNKVPWKIGMLISLPVTLRPLIFLQKEAVLSPCNFATTHLTACILSFLLISPFNFATHETEDPFAMPHLHPFNGMLSKVTTRHEFFVLRGGARIAREGVNREKLTVKKIINTALHCYTLLSNKSTEQSRAQRQGELLCSTVRKTFWTLENKNATLRYTVLHHYTKTTKLHYTQLCFTTLECYTSMLFDNIELVHRASKSPVCIL